MSAVLVARARAAAPVDGTLLREESGAIWAIFGEARLLVPDPATLKRRFASTPVFQRWNGGPNGLPMIPKDGTLLREKSSMSNFVIQTGHKTVAPQMPWGRSMCFGREHFHRFRSVVTF